MKEKRIKLLNEQGNAKIKESLNYFKAMNVASSSWVCKLSDSEIETLAEYFNEVIDKEEFKHFSRGIIKTIE